MIVHAAEESSLRHLVESRSREISVAKGVAAVVCSTDVCIDLSIERLDRELILFSNKSPLHLHGRSEKPIVDREVLGEDAKVLNALIARELFVNVGYKSVDHAPCFRVLI